MLSLGYGSVFQDDPLCSFLKDDECRLDCSTLFFGECLYAWGPEIHYLRSCIKFESFLEEFMRKDED